MLNHEPEGSAGYNASSVFLEQQQRKPAVKPGMKNAFLLVAHRRVLATELLCKCYGNLSNQRLLLTYGFALEPCANIAADGSCPNEVYMRLGPLTASASQDVRVLASSLACSLEEVGSKLFTDDELWQLSLPASGGTASSSTATSSTAPPPKRQKVMAGAQAGALSTDQAVLRIQRSPRWFRLTVDDTSAEDFQQILFSVRLQCEMVWREQEEGASKGADEGAVQGESAHIDLRELHQPNSCCRREAHVWRAVSALMREQLADRDRGASTTAGAAANQGKIVRGKGTGGPDDEEDVAGLREMSALLLLKGERLVLTFYLAMADAVHRALVNTSEGEGAAPAAATTAAAAAAAAAATAAATATAATATPCRCPTHVSKCVADTIAVSWTDDAGRFEAHSPHTASSTSATDLVQEILVSICGDGYRKWHPEHGPPSGASEGTVEGEGGAQVDGAASLEAIAAQEESTDGADGSTTWTSCYCLCHDEGDEKHCVDCGGTRPAVVFDLSKYVDGGGDGEGADESGVYWGEEQTIEIDCAPQQKEGGGSDAHSLEQLQQHMQEEEAHTEANELAATLDRERRSGEEGTGQGVDRLPVAATLDCLEVVVSDAEMDARTLSMQTVRYAAKVFTRYGLCFFDKPLLPPPLLNACSMEHDAGLLRLHQQLASRGIRIGKEFEFKEVCHRAGSPGRLDVNIGQGWSGGEGVMAGCEGSSIGSPEVLRSPLWYPLVEAILGRSPPPKLLFAGVVHAFGSSSGPSAESNTNGDSGCWPAAKDQEWHMDGGHLFSYTHVACHCLNVFIPLCDVTPEMGPTQFLPGSHVAGTSDEYLAAKSEREIKICSPAGSALLFDYRW
jgi:hypothetical protein